MRWEATLNRSVGRLRASGPREDAGGITPLKSSIQRRGTLAAWHHPNSEGGGAIVDLVEFMGSQAAPKSYVLPLQTLKELKGASRID